MSINWMSLIESKRNEIVSLIQQAYQDACGGNPDLSYSVILDKEGNVRYTSDFHNSTPADVWEGNATYVFSKNGFHIDPNYREYFNDDGYMNDRLPELLNKYNEIYDADAEDIYDVDDLPGFLREYFPEWYEEIEQNEIEFELDSFDAEEALEQELELRRQWAVDEQYWK